LKGNELFPCFNSEKKKTEVIEIIQKDSEAVAFN
jgi:hypothetical protein